MRHYHIKIICTDDFEIDCAVAMAAYISNILEPDSTVKFDGHGNSQSYASIDIFIEGNLVDIDRAVRPILRASGYYPGSATIDVPWVN